jgi:hypothetical protein
MAACWQADPTQRPSASDAVRVVTDLLLAAQLGADMDLETVR